MIYVILAAGLGVAQFIAYALLFRRARQLARQLSDMRAERNSEWILHALRDVPEEQALQAVPGTWLPAATGQQPVRRKRHLGLYLGGGLAALWGAFGQTTRAAWQRNRGQILSGVVGATVASTAAAALVFSPWPNGSNHRAPSSAPPVTATVTSPPGNTPPTPSSSSAPPGNSSPLAAGPQATSSPTTVPVTPISETGTPSAVPGETGTASPLGPPPGTTVQLPSTPPASPTSPSPTSSAVFVNYMRCLAVAGDPFARAKLCHRERG